MTHQVVYSPSAHRQLRAIYDWLAGEAGPEIAQRFVLSIYEYCDDLADFPFRGRARDDLRSGMRVIGFRRRAVIAFIVADTKVEIHGVYYGGSDYETEVSHRTGNA